MRGNNEDSQEHADTAPSREAKSEPNFGTLPALLTSRSLSRYFPSSLALVLQRQELNQPHNRPSTEQAAKQPLLRVLLPWSRWQRSRQCQAGSFHCGKPSVPPLPAQRPHPILPELPHLTHTGTEKELAEYPQYAASPRQQRKEQRTTQTSGEGDWLWLQKKKTG